MLAAKPAAGREPCRSVAPARPALATRLLPSPPPIFPARREIVKQIDLWGIDMVFVVGGNGGNAGAAAIQEELHKNGILCRWGRRRVARVCVEVVVVVGGAG